MSDDAADEQGDEAGIVERLRARFEGEKREDDGGPEGGPIEPGPDSGGMLSRMREKLGMGGGPREDETPKPSREDQDAAGGDEDAGPANGPSAQTEPEEGLDAGARDGPGEVDPSVAQPAEVQANRGPPSPASQGDRVPAAPSGPREDSQVPSSPPWDRRDREKIAPAPPAGGDAIPGHPSLGGRAPDRPGPDRGFEDVEVPEPEVLHERVDALLDRYEGSWRRST